MPAPTHPVLIGVLDLQGAVREHLAVLHRLGVPSRRVRLPEDLDGLDALIIPGGESTTVGRLMDRRGIGERIGERAGEGMPVFGTCMGLILLARRIEGSDQARLGLMDIGVQRNAYGSQVDSFEADLEAPALGGEPVRAVFIRAPAITDTGPGVETLALWNGRPAAVRDAHCLGTAFHPELTDDDRFHRLFLRMAEEHRAQRESGGRRPPG